jgi:hypothetical protein
MLAIQRRVASVARVWLCLVAAFLAISLPASAAELRVLVDLDNNPATGCSITTPAGTVTGIEQRFTTTIDTTVSPPRVTGVVGETCGTGGTFGGPTAVSAGGWNVGVGNGTGGDNVIETLAPVPPGVPQVRLAFVYDDPAIGTDALIAQAGGAPIVVVGAAAFDEPRQVPALSSFMLAVLVALMGGVAYYYIRRSGIPMGPMAVVMLAFVATMAWAAIVLDGLTNDWAGISPVAMDATGDAPDGSDISAVFARIEGSSLFVRVDAKMGRGPQAVADNYTATPGVTLNIPAATGVLANDLRGAPPAIVAFYGGGSLGGAVTGHLAGTTTLFGAGGSLTVNPNGSLAFTPPTGFTGSFTFTYRLANLNGFSDALVTIAAREAPVFTSANAVAFTLGNAGSFTVSATGQPAPTFALTAGTLPAGVTFNGATGVLSGTPATGTAGTHALTFTASNGVLPNAVQNFTLTVNQGVAITSANATTFTVGAAGTFSVTTTSSPAAGTITATGTLPAGVTFTNNGNGTASLAGTPGAGTGGTYALTINASNGVGAPGVQSFTLTVTQAPAITSGNAAIFTVGTAGTFNVSATGFPIATLSAAGALPSGVSFTNNGNGSATLAGTPAAATGGSYPLTITAANGVGANATQAFTLTVNASSAAQPDNYSIAHDTPLNVAAPGILGNDSGVPAPTLTSVTGNGAACSAFPCTVATVQGGSAVVNANGGFLYTPAAAFAGVDTFTYAVVNSAGPSGATVTITVTDAAPVVDLNGGTATGIDFGPVTFTEGSGAIAIVDAAQLTVTDTDSANLASATIVLTNLVDAGAETIALTCPAPAPGCSGAILPADVVITPAAGPPATLTITITRVAPLADYQALLRTLTYNNTSLNPTATPNRDIAVTVNDGIVDSAAAHATVAISGVNDAPTITAPLTATTPVDTALSFPGTVSVADPDAGASNVQVTITANNGTASLSAAAGLTVTGNGSGSVVSTGPITSQNTALSGLSFTPASGFNGSTNLDIVISDLGNTGTGGAKTATHQITITVDTRPTVSTTSPANNATAVVSTSTITVNFSEPVNATLASSFKLECPAGTARPFTLSASPSASFVLTPTSSLPATTTCTVTVVAAQVTDIVGQTLAADHVFSFSTNTSPAITSANSTTFTIGQAGSFSVTATGLPVPSIARGGVALPATVTFTDLGTGSGTLAGTPAAGTAGTYLLDFTATNSAGSSPAQAFTLTVAKAPQTISFTSAAPPGAAVAGATYNVAATATSGLPVAFTIDASASAVCSIAGSTVSFTAAGTCVVNANQAGDASYLAAPQVQQSFTVAKGSQTVSFTSTAPVAAAVAGATYTVAGTSTSGLAVAFTIDASASAVCSIAGSTVSFIGAGTCVINANQAGNANYNAAPQAQQSFAVAKGSQTVSFTSAPPVAPTVGGPAYTVSGTATSGLAVSFTIDASASAVCSIAGSTVSFIGSGSCIINANQAGNANYNAATQVQQSFQVRQTQSLTFTSSAPSTATVGGAAYTVTATATSGLAVTFTIDPTATAFCSIAGSSVSFTGVGTCVINANQAGDASYYAAAQVQQSFPVRNGQTISFTTAAPNPAKYQGATYAVAATATSGLGVTLTIDATAGTVCSLAGATVSFIGTGTCVINANQAGNASFNAAPQVQQSFDVVPNVVADGYSALGNVRVDSSAGGFTVVSNDIFPAGTTISAFDAASVNGGTVLMTLSGPNMGQFTYDPPVGYIGSDTFTYTLLSNGKSAAGTVTFTVSGMVWFINNNAGACPASPCDGRLTHPFVDTSNFQGQNTGAALKPSASQAIFVYSSLTPYSGAVTLLNAQRLVGQGAAADLATRGAVTAQPGQTLPLTGGTPPVLGSPGIVLTALNNNFVHGVTLGNGTTALSGSGFGTLTVNDNVSINTNGRAIDLTNGTFTATLNGVTSTGGANNVSLIQVAGTSNLGSGTLSGATGTSFAMGTIAPGSGGNATVTYNGTISQATNNQAPLLVQNRTGGTLTLTGTVTATSAGVRGISLLNNGGSTTSLSGTLTLSTGAFEAFRATGGGTVTATGGGSTLVSTTAAALNVANTTIGAGGLNFQSVSSSGGTGNGIILDNTGSTAGLTVNGDGSNTAVGGNSTGGTISNKSGADLNPTNGIGIYLNNTANVVLRRMTINGTNQNYGIRGNQVNGFVLEYSTVGGTNGTAALLATPENYGEGAIHFGNATTNGVTGVVTFTKNNISGGRSRNLSIVNTTAGTTTLTIKGNTFGAIQNFADGNQSLAVEARVNGGVVINSTVGGTVAGEPNTFTSAPGDLVNFTGQDNTTMDVVFRNNTLSNNHPQNVIGGGSLTLATSGAMTFNVDGNTFRDANGSAITLFKASSLSGTPSQLGIFNNNTIGVNGLAGSGSATGNGIFVSAGGTGTLGYRISNNTIRGIEGNAHIFADNTGGSYTANFNIQGNILDQPGATEFAAIAVTNGAPTSGDTINVCANIGGPALPQKNTINFPAALGIVVGLSGAPAGHTFNLPGLATLTEAGAESFLAVNNTGLLTVDAYNDPPATFATLTGFGVTCPTP